MRIESSVTAISWIPSEAISGVAKLPFELGVTSYDDPLPEVIEDVEGWLAGNSFRFINRLRAWIEVEDSRITDYGHAGCGYIGVSQVKLGSIGATFQGVPLPDIRPEPEAGNDFVRFVQTAGGRTALPAPRRVRRKPYFQFSSPIAWSTLALTVRADGSSDHEVVGASTFPRHWIYDHSGKHVAKTGLIDYDKWYREAFGQKTPWGDEDSPAVTTEVETALERELSTHIMRGGENPRILTIDAGETLVNQGDPGNEIYLLLDGIVDVEVDGQEIAELGPGAVLGERALLEGGTRTSTLRAVTPCKVAAASGNQIERDALVELAAGHRREERPSE
jgi:hypothetical protein